MSTSFSDLSYSEQQSDLHEASKFDAVITECVKDLEEDLLRQNSRVKDAADMYDEIGLDGVARVIRGYAYGTWYIFRHIMATYRYDKPEEGR